MTLRVLMLDTSGRESAEHQPHFCTVRSDRNSPLGDLVLEGSNARYTGVSAPATKQMCLHDNNSCTGVSDLSVCIMTSGTQVCLPLQKGKHRSA